VIAEPAQVEPGEHDTGDLAIAVVETLREMYHFLATGLIDPVVSDGKTVLSHSTRKEREILQLKNMR
jgi:hypothetical protein